MSTLGHQEHLLALSWKAVTNPQTPARPRQPAVFPRQPSRLSRGARLGDSAAAGAVA